MKCFFNKTNDLQQLFTHDKANVKE